MLFRTIGAWIALMVLAILNGVLREALLTPAFGAPAGHVLSTLILCGLILLVAWFSIRWLRPDSRQEAWLIGGVWLVLTLAFEFLAGHYLFGNPWEKLLADYNVFAGRIWPLVPLTTLLSPILAFRQRLV